MTLDDFYAALEAALPAVDAGEVKSRDVWPRLRVIVAPSGMRARQHAVQDPLGVVYFHKTGMALEITKTARAGLSLGLEKRAVIYLAAASDADGPHTHPEIYEVRARLEAILTAYFRAIAAK